MSAANDFVDVIRDLIQQELSKRDSTTMCEILEQVGEDHYNVCTVSDPDTVLHNVVNMTKFELKKGDFVYIYNLNGQLNNSFICYKIIPYIAPSVTQGSVVIDKTYILRLLMNKNKLNQDLGAQAVKTFIDEVNSNSLNKAFLSYQTGFEYIRPYYYEYYKAYWMSGKSKGTLGNLGNFVFNDGILKITKVTLKITNGFTINNLTRTVASNVNPLELGIVAIDKDGNRIGEKVDYYLDQVSRGTSLSSVPEYDITIGDGETPIYSVEIVGLPRTGRINIFEMSFKYSL